jgi:hypothetical protein
VWASPSETRQSDSFDIIDEYEALMHSIDSKHFPNEICKHREDSFWRTLIWNADGTDRYPVSKRFGEYFAEMRSKEHFILPLNDDKAAGQKVTKETHKRYRAIPRGNASEYYEAFVRNGLNRRFFITSKGHLGSGPPHMKMDDGICILLGLKSPAILRRVAGEDKYEWVGQAYVHGVMCGEALSSLSNEWNFRTHNKTLSIRDFCLV